MVDPNTLEMQIKSEEDSINLLIVRFKQLKDRYVSRGRERIIKVFRKEIVHFLKNRVITMNPGETVESAAEKMYEKICSMEKSKKANGLDCPGPTDLDSSLTQTPTTSQESSS